MKHLVVFIACLCSVCWVQAQEDELEHYTLAYRTAVKEKNSDSIAAACCRIAEYYSYRNSDSVKTYCLKGLKYADKNVGEPYLNLLNDLGYYYNSIGDNPKSIEIFYQTLKESERLRADDKMKGDILSSLGVCYRRINMPDSALYYYNKALTCYRNVGDAVRDDTAFLLTNLAVLYANSSRLDEADRYIRQAIEEIQGSEDEDTRLYVSNTAGSIFVLLQKFDDAEQIMRSSLTLAQKENKARFVLQCVSPLLSLYNRTGNRAALDKLVRETQPWLKKIDENSNESLGYYEALAEIYYTEGRYQESLEVYRLLLEAENQNRQSPLKYVYLWMARNYSHLNRPVEASRCYEQALAMTDSIHNTAISQQMSEFSVRFETQQMELEVAQLNQEKLQQRNLTLKWGILAGLVLLLAVLWLLIEIFRRRQQKQKAELDVAKSFIDGLEQERTRLAKELHDGICNDLLGVGMMLNLKERDEETIQTIRRSIEDIRSEVRSISHELTPPKFQYASLDEIVEKMLQELFVARDIQFFFEKEGTDVQWTRIPNGIAYEFYRIIQEISSNIVQHAEATKVSVSFQVSDTDLKLTFLNDGKKFNYADPGTHRGIGLSTIEERLKSIGASFTTTSSEKEQKLQVEVSFEKK